MDIAKRVLARVKATTDATERTLEAAEFMNGDGVQRISIVEKTHPRAGGDVSHTYVLRTYADHFGLNVASETSIGSWPAAAWLADALSRTAGAMRSVRPLPDPDYWPDIFIKNGEQHLRRWEKGQETSSQSITARVLARYRRSMEHPTEKDRKQYLHDHPHADPANHTVAKPGDHGGGHGEHHENKPKKSLKERLQSMGEKAKSFVKNAPGDLKKFFEDEGHRRKVLQGAHEKLVKAPEKLIANAVHTVKHEVKEFKEAGEGVAAVMKGGKMNDHQKKALKTVGFHLALTAVATVLTTTGGPLAGAAVFGKSMAKHVAMKSVSNALGHLHVLEEMGHIGHGIHGVMEHLMDKLATDEKANPEDVMAQFFVAAAAKELANVDDDTIADAIEGMDKADEAPSE